MKLPIADALESKKFLAFLTTMLVVVGNKCVGHWGYELDASQVGMIVASGAAYILGQGIADHGSTAAQIQADSTKATLVSTGAVVVPATAPSPKGFVRLGLMIAIAILGASILALGCATSSRNKALGASVATLDAAEVGLHAYCHQHTEDVIAAAPKTEDGQVAARNELDAFRAKCDKAQADIDGAYRTSTAAGVANDDPSLAKFKALVQTILAEITTIGVKP